MSRRDTIFGKKSLNIVLMELFGDAYVHHWQQHSHYLRQTNCVAVPQRDSPLSPLPSNPNYPSLPISTEDFPSGMTIHILSDFLNHAGRRGRRKRSQHDVVALAGLANWIDLFYNRSEQKLNAANDTCAFRNVIFVFIKKTSPWGSSHSYLRFYP